MRGLKFPEGLAIPEDLESHPAWDAWIEICLLCTAAYLAVSHPAWDAWIEIYKEAWDNWWKMVASRMGCVD